MLRKQYGIVAFLCLFAWMGVASAGTVPAPSEVTVTYRKGRTVQVRLVRIRDVGEVIYYDVYRDGVKLVTMVHNEKDPETDGQVWYPSLGYQYFFDNSAFPGETHEYMVVTRVGTEESVGVTKEITVPLPSFSFHFASHQKGRTVYLTWGHVQNFPELRYQIFRDNEKIAEFAQSSSGDTDNGDSWGYSSIYQHFYDNNAIPGKTHNYTAKIILFEGSEATIQTEKQITIPVPSFTMHLFRYERGRTVYLSWVHLRNFPELRYQIFRDNEKVAEFGPESTGVAANGDSWKFNDFYQYFYDNNAIPGQTHSYRVKIVLFDGSEAVVQDERDVSVPFPAFTIGNPSYSGGRTIYFSWSPITDAFPDVNYQVFRDGVKRAEFPARTEGTGENGDTWSFSGTNQRYYDNQVYPGQTHTYKFVATLFPGSEITREAVYTVPRSAFTSVNISYSGVRTVQLFWSRITHSAFDVSYAVYRDGELLNVFEPDVAGSAENGDSWKIQGSNQYYYDANAWPGKVHEYKVVARLFPGCELDVAKDIQIPQTILPATGYTYQNGRNVQLHWAKIAAHPTFDAIQYTVFRDGVELASFTADTEGTGTNNDSWRSAGNYQYYVDGTATPWQTHQYKVEARLFAGCTVARESNYTVPGPKVTSPSPTVMSVNSVSLNLGSNSATLFTDATLEIYRNGEKIDTLTPTQNAFPRTYLDTSINVPDGPHYYQFLFRLYPGCDSGMSAEFPLTVPTPQVPALTLVSNEYGAVKLRCAGANITTPQVYDIYENDIHIATTGVGTKVDFVHANNNSGLLSKYEVRTRFFEFPDSYVSEKSAPLYLAAKLAPGELIGIVSRHESNVSPAWMEGESSVADIPVEFEVDGLNKGQVTYYSDTSWYANTVTDATTPKGIPLDPDRSVALGFIAGDDVIRRWGTEITWTATDVSRRSASDPAIHIRKGDSLLLTATGPGTLLEIDADGDGVFELSGAPGQKFPVAFNTSGIVTVSARIDGVDTGSLNVAVVSVSDAPEVCYLRTLSASEDNHVFIDFEEPHALFPEIGAYVPESSNLTLSTSQHSSNSLRYTLVTKRDSYIETSLMVRLRHYRGPALSQTKLRVIMVSIDGRSYSPVLERYADGTCLFGNTISMVERFPVLSMKVNLTNAGVMFADTGTTVRIVRSDEFDENGQANVYILSKPTDRNAGYSIAAEMLVDEN